MAPTKGRNSSKVKHESSSSGSSSQDEPNPSSKSSSKQSSESESDSDSDDIQMKRSKSIIRKSTNLGEKKILDSYLNSHPNITIKESKPSKTFTFNSNEITENDEIWILTCPQDVQVESLINNKIKLNGVTRFDQENIECKVVPLENSSQQQLTVISKDTNSNTTYNAFSFQPKGKIHLHEKVVDSSIIDFDDYHPQIVPFPTNLKVRHPIHGRKYENLVTIPENIKSLLKKARSESKSKPYSRIIIKQEPDTGNSQDETDMIPKRAHKKKHKIKQTDSDGGPKKIKVEAEENLELDWIKKM